MKRVRRLERLSYRLYIAPPQSIQPLVSRPIPIKSASHREQRTESLNEVLALWLGDEGLQFGGGEGVDEAGLGDDEEEDLGAGEGGELVRLADASGSEERAGRVRTGRETEEERDGPFS